MRPVSMGRIMAVAIETEVREVLARREETILAIAHGAWNDWLELPNRSRLRFARTRANIVHDFMIDRAMSAFSGDADVHPIVKDETAKFLFDRRVLVRFKKGDGNGLGSNIETQAVLAFTDPQLLIPGLPDVQKVDVVYVLNDLQTMIERVAVSARDNDIRLWSYDIEDRSGAVILPLAQPVAPEDGAKVVRLRPRSDQARDDKNRG
jgi:hypothetical protein